jgi:hypothetical protein
MASTHDGIEYPEHLAPPMCGHFDRQSTCSAMTPRIIDE